MVGTRGAQPLSYDLRLPDTAPADALRLLDASRAISYQALTTLWPRLDVFTAARTGPAWKQVDALRSRPEPHGRRQWRLQGAGGRLPPCAPRPRASGSSPRSCPS